MQSPNNLAISGVDCTLCLYGTTMHKFGQDENIHYQALYLIILQNMHVHEKQSFRVITVLEFVDNDIILILSLKL
jgi:hypothetical protein